MNPHSSMTMSADIGKNMQPLTCIVICISIWVKVSKGMKNRQTVVDKMSGNLKYGYLLHVDIVMLVILCKFPQNFQSKRGMHIIQGILLSSAYHIWQCTVNSLWLCRENYSQCLLNLNSPKRCACTEYSLDVQVYGTLIGNVKTGR